MSQWLDECLQHHQAMQQQLQQQQQQQAEAAAPLPDPQLFAAVVGTASEQERVRSAKAAAERDVAGGWLSCKQQQVFFHCILLCKHSTAVCVRI
jgi:hypothetical protein